MVELFERYAARCPWTIALQERVLKKTVPPAELKRAEAQTLRQALRAADVIIALDEGGRTPTSQSFAGQIGKLRDQGQRDVCFLIGGADGLDEELLAEADDRIAFGAMTWPHFLVRVMLAEQLYRASTILAGHPYHRR